MRNQENAEIEIDRVLAISSSGKAMKVIVSETGEEVWIPISLIVYDGEDACDVSEVGDSGTLVVKRWFAVKEGLVDE